MRIVMVLIRLIINTNRFFLRIVGFRLRPGKYLPPPASSQGRPLLALDYPGDSFQPFPLRDGLFRSMLLRGLQKRRRYVERPGTSSRPTPRYAFRPAGQNPSLLRRILLKMCLNNDLSDISCIIIDLDVSQPIVIVWYRMQDCWQASWG